MGVAIRAMVPRRKMQKAIRCQKARVKKAVAAVNQASVCGMTSCRASHCLRRGDTAVSAMGATAAIQCTDNSGENYSFSHAAQPHSHQPPCGSHRIASHRCGGVAVLDSPILALWLRICAVAKQASEAASQQQRPLKRSPVTRASPAASHWSRGTNSAFFPAP